MAAGLEQLAQQAMPSLLGAGAGIGISAFMSQPKVPQLNIPSITLPEPTPPPRAPLSPSLTAAAQRARTASEALPKSNSDIVLTSPAGRKRDDSALTLSRTTLLGR